MNRDQARQHLDLARTHLDGIEQDLTAARDHFDNLDDTYPPTVADLERSLAAIEADLREAANATTDARAALTT